MTLVWCLAHWAPKWLSPSLIAVFGWVLIIVFVGVTNSLGVLVYKKFDIVWSGKYTWDGESYECQLPYLPLIILARNAVYLFLQPCILSLLSACC